MSTSEYFQLVLFLTMIIIVVTLQNLSLNDEVIQRFLNQSISFILINTLIYDLRSQLRLKERTWVDSELSHKCKILELLRRRTLIFFLIVLDANWKIVIFSKMSLFIELLLFWSQESEYFSHMVSLRGQVYRSWILIYC